MCVICCESETHEQMQKHMETLLRNKSLSISSPSVWFDRRKERGGERRVSEVLEDERTTVSSPLTTERLKRNKMFPLDGWVLSQ